MQVPGAAVRETQERSGVDAICYALSLGSCRYLVKSYEKAQQGEKLAGSVKYLQVRISDVMELKACPLYLLHAPRLVLMMVAWCRLQESPGSHWQVSGPEDLLNPQVQVQGWKALLAALVGAASEKVLARARVTNMNEAFQYCQVS